jgi:hypothetical protein
MSKRREITFEIEQRFIIKRQSGQKTTLFCSFCQKEIEMLSTDKAALLTGCNSRTIFDWVELGLLHFTETSEGLLMICKSSLEETINF